MWSCFPEYYSRLPEAMIILNSMKLKPKSVHEFLKRSDEGCERIEDVLVFPKEYLSKVIGSLENLANDMDIVDSKFSLEMLSQTLKECEEELTRGQNRVKLRKWEQVASIEYGIQRRGRTLVKEGNLERITENGGTQVVKCSLFTDLVIFFRKGNIKTASRMYWLSESSFRPDSESDLIMLFTNEGKILRLRCKTSEKLAEWGALLWMKKCKTVDTPKVLPSYCGICHEKFTTRALERSNCEDGKTETKLSSTPLVPCKSWPGMINTLEFSSTVNYECRSCGNIACDVCSHQYKERDGSHNIICARCKISGMLEDTKSRPKLSPSLKISSPDLFKEKSKSLNIPDFFRRLTNEMDSSERQGPITPTGVELSNIIVSSEL